MRPTRGAAGALFPDEVRHNPNLYPHPHHIAPTELAKEIEATNKKRMRAT
jgi:hypothetical protein